MSFRLLLIFALFSAPAFAFDIPKGLYESDRLEIIRTLGLNSATKLLTNPYPLGGYSGFEVGLSTEFINITDIRHLGCAPGSAGCANTSVSDETEWRFARLTVGKGLYEDIDIFLHFIPPLGGVRVTDFGASLRWSAYQARFLPINVSLVAQFDQLNYKDTFVNRNVGGDVIVGVDVENFSLFFGGGMLQASGTFIGKNANGVCGEDCTVASDDPTVDASAHTVTNHVTATHTVVGLSLHFEDLFAAAEVDRYQDAVYSMKVGLRF